MVQRDFLTENQVIQGVENYLKQKGRTSHKRVICKADAKRKEHGVDLTVKLENERKNGNWYFNETYGTIHRIASAGVRLLGRVYFACGNPDYSTVISTLSIASNSNFWASSKVSPLVII